MTDPDIIRFSAETLGAASAASRKIRSVLEAAYEVLRDSGAEDLAWAIDEAAYAAELIAGAVQVDSHHDAVEAMRRASAALARLDG